MQFTLVGITKYTLVNVIIYASFIINIDLCKYNSIHFSEYNNYTF